MSPESTTRISSPYSRTYMFFPISPTPPRGIKRSSFSPPLRRLDRRFRLREERVVPFGSAMVLSISFNSKNVSLRKNTRQQEPKVLFPPPFSLIIKGVAPGHPQTTPNYSIDRGKIPGSSAIRQKHRRKNFPFPNPERFPCGKRPGAPAPPEEERRSNPPVPP